MSNTLVTAAYVVAWYAGNIAYSSYNKAAAHAPLSKEYAMTIATVQLGVGVIYALFLWIAPDTRAKPRMTIADIIKCLPQGICSAGAHAASVFALAAGGVTMGQIVKAAEPAFAAFIGVFIYGKKYGIAKALCLIPIIGGVALAALKFKGDTWEINWHDEKKSGILDGNIPLCVLGACIANVFAAFKGQEGHKLFHAAEAEDVNADIEEVNGGGKKASKSLVDAGLLDVSALKGDDAIKAKALELLNLALATATARKAVADADEPTSAAAKDALKLAETKEGPNATLQKRIGGPGNTFAVGTIISFLVSVPLVLFKEYDLLGSFWTAVKYGTPAAVMDTTKGPCRGCNFQVPGPTPFVNSVTFALIMSGITFYMYNEVAMYPNKVKWCGRL